MHSDTKRSGRHTVTLVIRSRYGVMGQVITMSPLVPSVPTTSRSWTFAQQHYLSSSWVSELTITRNYVPCAKIELGALGGRFRGASSRMDRHIVGPRLPARLGDRGVQWGCLFRPPAQSKAPDLNVSEPGKWALKIATRNSKNCKSYSILNFEQKGTHLLHESTGSLDFRAPTSRGESYIQKSKIYYLFLYIFSAGSFSAKPKSSNIYQKK